MLQKYGNDAAMEMVKVKVLRGFQNYEIGSIIELPKSRFKTLESRKMVVRFDIQPPIKVVEPPTDQGSENNRAVGLPNSPESKKTATRKK